MSLDLTLLTNHAECDEVLTDLTAELDTYTHRDGNLHYDGRQAERVKTSIAGRLIGINAKIDSYTATLAQPGLPADLRKTTIDLLETATYQKSRLTKRQASHAGAEKFLAEVDAEQNTMQVTVLTNAITLVTNHRNTLPS